jgi:hypothetical protein
MFQETDNQQYAGGGIIAFADGAEVGDGSNFDAFKQAIIQQESGGRYGVPNAEGSGALGLVQLMPTTAKNYAAQLGVDYRPDLLSGTSDAAKKYQDMLADASLKDDWNYAGGDPAKAAAHHFGGSDTSHWGPKTRQYQQDILGRMGQAGAGATSGNDTGAEWDAIQRANEARLRPDTTEQDAYIAKLKQLQSPEALEAQNKQDIWGAVASFAKGLGTTPGGFLTGLVAGINDAASSTAERKALEKQKLLDVSKAIADASGAKQKEVFDSIKDATSITKDRYDAKYNASRIDNYILGVNAKLQVAQDKLDAATAGKAATEARRSATSAYNEALKADADLGRMLAPAGLGKPPVSPQALQAQQMKIHGLIRQMSEANALAVSKGEQPIQFDTSTLSNYNRYGLQTGSWPGKGTTQGQAQVQAGNTVDFNNLK